MKHNRILHLLLLSESIIVIVIGIFAIKNEKSCHLLYTQLKDLQSNYHQLSHALVENINLINEKDEHLNIFYEYVSNKINTPFVRDSVICIMFSKVGCGGCAISLINQLIDDTGKDIVIILESGNQQIESTFSNDKKVSVMTLPLMFYQDCPPCRIIYQKQGSPRILSYYSEMANYLDYFL